MRVSTGEAGINPPIPFSIRSYEVSESWLSIIPSSEHKYHILFPFPLEDDLRQVEFGVIANNNSGVFFGILELGLQPLWETVHMESDQEPTVVEDLDCAPSVDLTCHLWSNVNDEGIHPFLLVLALPRSRWFS